MRPKVLVACFVTETVIGTIVLPWKEEEPYFYFFVPCALIFK